MKKYLAIGLILCASLMSACSEKVTVVSDSGTITSEKLDENFIYLQDENIDVVYDVRTDIVYYCNTTYYGHPVITPFYGKDKQLVTRNEFIKNYMK